jgi:hypothetical protein
MTGTTARTRTDARLVSYSLLYLPNRLRPISMAFDGFLPSTGTSNGTRTATSERPATPLSRGPGGVGIRIVCSWPCRRAMACLWRGRKTRGRAGPSQGRKPTREPRCSRPSR